MVRYRVFIWCAANPVCLNNAERFHNLWLGIIDCILRLFSGDETGRNPFYDVLAS